MSQTKRMGDRVMRVCNGYPGCWYSKILMVWGNASRFGAEGLWGYYVPGLGCG